LKELERDIGTATWVDLSSDPHGIEQFIELESRSWKSNVAQGGEGLATSELGATWFRDMTAHLRERESLCVGGLYADGEPVYLAVCYKRGKSWFGGRDVYDPRLARYSPGMLGRLAFVEWFRSTQAGIFDSCINSSVYPKALDHYPDSLDVGTIVIAGNRAGALVLRALSAGRERRWARMR